MSELVTTPPAGAGQPFTIDVPLASLAPGEYLLELSAAAEGHSSVTELVAFRVKS